jgi:hypothetical protein
MIKVIVIFIKVYYFSGIKGFYNYDNGRRINL